MKCPKCGIEISDNSVRCYNCDADLSFSQKRNHKHQDPVRYSDSAKSYPPQYPYPMPYPPYPYYPYPYYPFRPSYYSYLYQQQPQKPRLRLDLLFKILFKPKSAFIELYHQTTMKEGIVIFLILTIISTFITLIGSFVLPITMYGSYGTPSPSSYSLLLIIPLIMIPISLLLLLASGWLTAKISKGIGQGFGDANKTIGFFGYAAIVGFFIGIIQTIIFIGITPLEASGADSPNDIYGSLGYFFIRMIITIIISIITIIWYLIVYGTAASVANDVSVRMGIVSYFLAAIIIAVIYVAIFFAIIFFTIMQIMPS